MPESFGVKFYIHDSTTSTTGWVDFTDRISRSGTNRLVEIGNIIHNSENQAVGGAFTSSTNNVIMDNHDGFWDNPDDWASLKTIGNDTAIWNTSDNGGEISLQKTKCRIVIETLQKDGTVREDTIGVFYIQDFSTDTTSGTAKLKTVGLSHYLRKMDASKIKSGQGWYENKPIVFLMKELLKLEFADDNDDLPVGFTFPDIVSIPTFDGNRTFSGFGRPPEWDGTDWREDGLICRASVWKYDSGATSNVEDGLYLGCDNELWLYSLDTDDYFKIGEVASGYNIKRIWVDTSRDYLIYGASWGDVTVENINVSIKIFKYDGITFSTIKTINNVVKTAQM